MKEPGDILLISSYSLGHQPLGVASPAGFLRRAGYRPEAVDLATQKLNLDCVTRTKFVGISVPMHTALRIGYRVAEQIRTVNTTCHICFYGLYASLNAETLLTRFADSVIGGEYETPLVELIESLANGRKDVIRGVWQTGNPASVLLSHLPFVVPDRTLLPPLEEYVHLKTDTHRLPTGYVEASRGCRHLCRHCPIPPVYDGKFFLVPKEMVMEDIRTLVKMGALHITFGDPDFLNGPNHSLKIVKWMHQEFPHLTFDFTAKIEHLLKHRALIPIFGALGCRFIVSAVESLSNVVLAHLAKGHTCTDVTTVLDIVSHEGIALRPSLVTFTPWTTLKDILDLFDFVESKGLIDYIDPVQYTIRLLIPPGSWILEEAGEKPWLGNLIPEQFTYQWYHPDARMDALQVQFSQAVKDGMDVDDGVTFYRLRELAYAAHDGRSPMAVTLRPDPLRYRPPRLTEPWFCCAEPTEDQFAMTGGEMS